MENKMDYKKELLKDFLKWFDGGLNYLRDNNKLIEEYLAESESIPIEPPVKVQIAEKIKEVIEEKKNNIQSAIRNDDRYMKQCFDSELEAIEDLLERLKASNLSA